MRYIRLVLLIFTQFCVVAYAQNVTVTITVHDSLKPISPYIYGTNSILTGIEGWGAFRQGGNRYTGYNWENNASNAGSDYFYNSDNYLTYILGINNPDSANIPGIVTARFQSKAIALNAYSLVTLQMAGFVAKDKNGKVSQSETAPSARWAQVKDFKGSPFSLKPDTADRFVYMDEYVHFLTSTFGTSIFPSGIRAYSLDNEPALWPSTHARIHPLPTTCGELIQKSVSLSEAVKSVDSDAEIFGPALYGFAAYTNFQSAPDWNTVIRGKSYSWVIDYYLDQMKQAQDSTGIRLLDVLDLHWYPEAIGVHRITDNSATTYKDKLARVQAPRTLWDKNYTENSWIGQYGKAHLPLIPNIISSINKYYPGTKLSFSEFTYGGENDISGAIAVSDVLGIFAKYGVYFAAFWPVGSSSAYVSSAYKIYRNYDGNYSRFGNYYIPSNSNDSVNTSVYASLDDGTNEIHVIAINKSFTQNINAEFSISSDKNFISGRVWELDSTSSQIKEIAPVNSIVNNSFSYDLPAASVCHFVIKSSGAVSDVNIQRNMNPGSFALTAYPNPFNPSCNIQYKIAGNSTARIDIISVTGEVVKSFTGLSHSGNLSWNGTDKNNGKVSSGVYCAVLRNSSGILSIYKLLLLK